MRLYPSFESAMIKITTRKQQSKLPHPSILSSTFLVFLFFCLSVFFAMKTSPETHVMTSVISFVADGTQKVFGCYRTMEQYLSAQIWPDLQTSESCHQDGMMSHPTTELLKLQKAPVSWKGKST